MLHKREKESSGGRESSHRQWRHNTIPIFSTSNGQGSSCLMLLLELIPLLRTQGDGTWLSDKFLSHDVTKHIFCNAFACWNKWAWRCERQVKECCHMSHYARLLLQSRIYSASTAILYHWNSFQQTQIMGNADVHAFIVTSSTSLFKDKITGEIPDMVQQEPWWWSN